MPVPVSYATAEDQVRVPPHETSAEPLPRLLYVATSANDGGIERYSVRLAAVLRQRGAEIWFACRSDGIIARHCLANGISVLPFRVRNSGDLRAAWQLAKWITSERIDLVHVHSRRDYLPAVLGVMLARCQGRRVRLVLHAHMLRPLGTPRGLSGRLFSRHADAVIAVAEAVRANLIATHRFSPDFVHLLHNGVDLTLFNPPGTSSYCRERLALRRAWSISSDAIVLVMIGRLDAKGQELLLSVASALVSAVPDLYFVLVGSEGAVGQQERLHDLASRYGVAEHVRFTGPREDIPAVLAASDLLAHLPTDEAFGLAIVEAMASGLPTVATNVGGCQEVLQDGITGVLIPPQDSEALLQAVRCLLTEIRYSPRYIATGMNGRRRAEQFSLKTQVDLLETLYRTLCPHLLRH